VRLHWRARQWDVDTGEGPRRYRRYLRDVRSVIGAYTVRVFYVRFGFDRQVLSVHLGPDDRIQELEGDS